MSVVRVLGLDPGFAKFGWATVEIHPEGDYVVGMGLITTKKDTRKGKVLATDDNFRRALAIADGLLEVCAAFGPQVITAEGLSHSRNASAMTKVGMGWGVLAAITRIHKIPVLQATPQAIKKAVCGDLKATKLEIQAALDERFGDLIDLLNGIAKGQWEHPYDAAGSVVACIDDPVILALARAQAS